MSTVGQIIDRTQRQLLSGVVEERNKLAASATATATSMTFAYDMAGIRQGSILEIGSELIYVWSVSTGSNTATVERAWNGTTASAHPSGSVAIVNPRFPRSQILESINDDLADLVSPSNGLYRVRTMDVKYDGNAPMINLPSSNDVIELLEVRLRYRSNDYPMIRRTTIVRNVPTSDFPSGTALKFNEPCRAGDLRITYKAPFNRVMRETDDMQTIAGYPLSAEDILVMGAQIRLMSPREIRRNFTESQGDTRRSDEVPAGSQNNSITNIMRLRRDRIIAEAAKLDSQYPVLLNRD